MPEEERKIVERTIPRSDALARRATALDPKNAEAFVALGYANMVQRRMLAAEDAFKQAIALNPNQADGLHVQRLLRLCPGLSPRLHRHAVSGMMRKSPNISKGWTLPVREGLCGECVSISYPVARVRATAIGETNCGVRQSRAINRMARSRHDHIRNNSREHSPVPHAYRRARALA